MSSMLSARASIPCTSDITLRPGSAAPGTPYPSHTDSLTSSSTPSRSAKVAINNSPASLTSRGSSNATRTASKAPRPHRNVRTVMHHMGDLLLQARRRRIRQLSACSGGHLNLTLGRTLGATRWIKAKCDGLGGLPGVRCSMAFCDGLASPAKEGRSRGARDDRAHTRTGQLKSSVSLIGAPTAISSAPSVRSAPARWMPCLP